jgi:hypothetical protein
MVQNGKLAACALEELMQLKRVDFPTLGRPTIPHLRDISKIVSTKILLFAGFWFLRYEVWRIRINFVGQGKLWQTNVKEKETDPRRR